MDEVRKAVTFEELLAGLAEECGELTQAALKLRRVYVSNNPTPVSENEANERLHEEIADVLLYVRMLDVNRVYIEDIITKKEERWKKRLGIV